MSWLRTSRFVCHQICRKSPLSVTKSLQKSFPISIQHDFHVLSLGANMTNSRFVATKAAPETSARRNPVDSSSRSEVVMHSVNLLVQRSGRVLLNDVLGLVNLLKTSSSINSGGQALFTLRCCGSVLVDCPGAQRQKIADEIWGIMQADTSFKMDVSHYNTLLRVYLDNAKDFSPQDVLTELASNELAPNRVTYQHLIAKFCQDGNITGASAILEHMKEMEMPVSEQVFHSLIFGHSKLGDFESADRVMVIMQDTGLEIDATAYAANLKGMIAFGKTYAEVSEALENLKDKGVKLNDQGFFDLIVAFVQNGQSEAARTLAEQLPRRSGFFNVLRNNIPKIVEHGDSELALSLLGQFQVPDNLPTNTNHSEAESRDYGMFILRSMTNNNYKPQQIFDTLEETNNDEEAFARVAIGLCQNYVMANKFEELGEFLKLTEDKLGRHVLLRSEPFQRMLRIYLQRNLSGREDYLRFIENWHKSGLDLPLGFLAQTILPRIYDPEMTGNFRLYSNYMDLNRRETGINYHSLGNASIQFALNKNNHDMFNEFGNFFHLTNGIKFQPATWKNSLARNYLLTQNLDVLKAALMLQSDHYIKTTKPNSNYPSVDTHLYGVLALIHQESHRFISDQTADEVLDTVLKDLVENKFGIPPSAVDELSAITDNADIKKRIDVLSQNYENLEQLWTQSTFIAFANQNKKAIVAKMPKGSADVRQRGIQRRHPLEVFREKTDALIEEGRIQEATKILDKARVEYHDLQFSYTIVDKYLQKKFKAENDFDQVMNEALDELKIERDSTEVIYSSTVLNISKTLIARGLYEEGIKALKFLIDNKPMLLKREDKLKDEVRRFLFELEGHVKDMDIYQKILDISSEILGESNDSMEGFIVKALLDSGDSEGALVKFEEIAEQDRRLQFLPQLVKEFTLQEDKARMQRLLDASVKVLREEGALYTIARIYLEMGRTPQARKLLQAPGLRYNERIVKNICKRLEESSPTALEEFIKLCVPLFSSDQTFLFETLVNCVSNDPDKLNDAWISMQEANYIPSDGLMLKMAKMYQSHGEEVPFSVEHLVDDQPPFEEIAEKPKKKVTQKELAKATIKKEVSEDIIKNYEDFTTKLAEENLEEVSNILLKSLEDKRANADMISSTIELMVKKEDFSKLEDVCTLTLTSVLKGFHIRLRDSLKMVPRNVIENLNLDPGVKTKLRLNDEKSIKNHEDFNTKLAEENLEEVSNILLKSLKNKKANLDMVGSTIELMIKKEDFSKLENVCKLGSKSNKQFQMKIRYMLESVPVDVLRNLNLDPKEKQKLVFNATVISKIAKNCSDLTSLFEQLKIEDYQFLKPQRCMEHLVTNEESAQKLIDKVNELKDSRMATNSFILLVNQELDSSALQLYKDFENSLDSEIINHKSNQETKTKMENLVKKHGLNIALT